MQKLPSSQRSLEEEHHQLKLTSRWMPGGKQWPPGWPSEQEEEIRKLKVLQLQAAVSASTADTGSSTGQQCSQMLVQTCWQGKEAAHAVVGDEALVRHQPHCCLHPEGIIDMMTKQHPHGKLGAANVMETVDTCNTAAMTAVKEHRLVDNEERQEQQQQQQQEEEEEEEEEEKVGVDREHIFQLYRARHVAILNKASCDKHIMQHCCTSPTLLTDR
jgi:hypothetical protein